MAETMLYGDLLESWKILKRTEGAMEVDKKFREKETGKYTNKVPRGERGETFKTCLGRLLNKFLKKHDARKQKTYMGSGLVRSKISSVDSISSRIKILNNHLNARQPILFSRKTD